MPGAKFYRLTPKEFIQLPKYLGRKQEKGHLTPSQWQPVWLTGIQLNELKFWMWIWSEILTYIIFPWYIFLEIHRKISIRKIYQWQNLVEYFVKLWHFEEQFMEPFVLFWQADWPLPRAKSSHKDR